MDGMLSQDEINALLSGMASGDITMDTLEEEASALASSNPIPVVEMEPTAPTMGYVELDDIEKDAIGEIANISMGTSATTLYSLVNRKVDISTPVVTMAQWDNVMKEYEKPCVFIQIKYTTGLDGANILVLKEQDVKVITDLMMGGDGTNIDGELGELHLSAISEAMNQMMGSSATSLSSMLGRMIDISPPEASLVNLMEFKKASDIAPFLEGTFVKISFRMQIEDLVDSTIMQLYPVDFARSLYEIFIGNQVGTEPEPAPAPKAPEPEPYVPPRVEETPMMNQAMPDMGAMNYGMPPMGMPPMGMPQMAMPQMAMPQMQPQPMNMNIQPAQFQTFSQDFSAMPSQENIGLIMDVPLEVTVELGRTKKSIAEILDFAPGTIVELNKIAGEPIDVLVNGKFVAKGEVVVIEESFGIRVTEIINNKGI
ncbi:MAG: flagellar motor switch phosphatase FliY [Lachnospiraceae bacterium]|nr:flagellar motor switch phosphatase FliY [Lachnospiraceae bacterium]